MAEGVWNGEAEGLGDALYSAEDWQQWGLPPATMGDESPLMPFWNPHGEDQKDQAAVFGFHTTMCTDFANGYCGFHKKKDKNGNPVPNHGQSTCFGWHFESQHRRPPADAATGRLLYWDVGCHTTEPGYEGPPCEHGDECIFAHSREEISYHPAKYKTRRCNGKGCRGESICCFAHNEAEIRDWAAARYSYWAVSNVMSGMGGGRGPVPPELGAATDADWPGAAGDDWQRPLYTQQAQVPATRHKQRFCASYPDVSQCRRGAACAFAHTREEAKTQLLDIKQEQQDVDALTEDFFMYKFKTLWCPIGVQHDWQTCVYAHNYQDARRQVDIGYGPKPCPYWAKKDPNAEYAQRCPLGLRCPYSHGAKEQLYHPQYFRTVVCRDLRSNACPRLKLCAFFHKRPEKRGGKNGPVDGTNYDMPLREDDLPSSWVADFLSPPFRDAATQGAAPDNIADNSYSVPPPPEEVSQPGAHEGVDAGNYWCQSGGYWDQNAGCMDAQMLEMAAAIGMGHLVLPPGMETDPSLQHESYLDQAGLLGMNRLASPMKLAAHDSDTWWDNFRPLPQLAMETDGSPRICSEEEDGDASTSAGGDFLAGAGSLLSQAASRSTAPMAAGAIGTKSNTSGSSSTTSSPWMLPSKPEPLCGWSAFGGASAFDGILSAVPVDGPLPAKSSMAWPLNSSSPWDPTEPATLPLIW